MQIITLTNDFHRTSVTLRPECEPHPECPETAILVHLTPGQTRKARKALCSCSGCRCAHNDAGTRGTQYSPDGKFISLVIPNLVS